MGGIFQELVTFYKNMRIGFDIRCNKNNQEMQKLVHDLVNSGHCVDYEGELLVFSVYKGIASGIVSP